MRISISEFFNNGGTPAQIIEFLSIDSPANTFMLGNIRSMGLEPSEIQEIFLEWEPDLLYNGGIRGILMVHYTHAMFFYPSIDDAPPSGFSQLLNELGHWLNTARINRINGLSRCMDTVAEFVNSWDYPPVLNRRSMRLAVYQQKPGKAGQMINAAEDPYSRKLPRQFDGLRLEAAQGPDWSLLDRIMDEKEQISEFIVTGGARETMKNAHIRGGARSYALIGPGGRIVSAVSSTAENRSTAMIVGVFTVIGFRRKGYSRFLMEVLIQSLKNDGLTPVLFYENPAAEQMYSKLGFHDCNGYDLLHFNQED